MDENIIKRALIELGKVLPPTPEIEILIVGGASGILTHELGGTRTTTDIDVLAVFPPDQWDLLQDAAGKLNASMTLPANWLNRDVGLYVEGLPRDWESRRVNIGRFGALQVWAIGRLDLIAMKFYGHRTRDREDIEGMNVNADEREFVRKFLDSITGSAN